MLQNYFLNFMYGERLYALQGGGGRDIHLSEHGTNSRSPAWNDQQEFCTRYEQDLPSIYIMHGIKHIHMNWLSAQKHKSDQSWEVILVTVQKQKMCICSSHHGGKTEKLILNVLTLDLHKL